MMLREDFQDHVSKSAFQVIDGELRIVGKWGQISEIGDKYDLWLVKPNLDPLGTRKISNISEKLPTKWHLRRLNGEAYTQTTDKAGLIAVLGLIGIRKKRIMSQKALDHLKKIRESR